MGDLVEITIQADEPAYYFKVPYGCMKVDIKSSRGSAAIGLSANLEDGCEYWIIIGHNQHTWISKGDDLRGDVVRTSNILNENEYRSFWVSWHDQSILFGREGQTKPIVSMICPMSCNINYALFSMKEMQLNNIVHCKFEMPPVIQRPQIKPITGGVVHWTRCINYLPKCAVIGGFEKNALYIIRSKHNESLCVGKFLTAEGRAVISYKGQSYDKDDFEMLVGYDCIWVPTYNDNVPVGAVVGGYSVLNGEALYVGRVRQHDHIIPGYVQLTKAACFIAYNGKEMTHKNYEILVGPSINTRCSNGTFRHHIYIDRPPAENELNEED